MKILILSLIFLNGAFALERKQEQFPTSFSYLIVPAPYQIPGLGSGWILWSSINNFVLDYVDIFAYKFSGAADGYGIGIKDIHIIPEYLFVKFGTERVKDATIQQFDMRGTNNSGDDYSYMSATDIVESNAVAQLTFWNRRINFFYKYYEQTYEVEEFSDLDSDEVLGFTNNPTFEKSYTSHGMLLDFTNDFQDPTIGLRMAISRLDNKSDNALSNSEFHVLNQAYNLYVPLGGHSTLVFHYSKSDAYLEKKGNDDLSEIEDDLNLKDCSSYSTSRAEDCEEVKANLLARVQSQNLYGEATSLGGSERLRGYPMGRFTGSHMKFYGTEFRWNLSADVVPFDFFLIKDTRSAFQIAFFYEIGTIGDNEAEMLDHWRDTKGAGLRVVTKSGYVFRLDYGTSDEGSEVTLLGSYPW